MDWMLRQRAFDAGAPLGCICARSKTRCGMSIPELSSLAFPKPRAAESLSELQGVWSRLEYMQEPGRNGPASIRQLTATLPASARWLYFKDDIGNVSTSAVRFGYGKVRWCTLLLCPVAVPFPHREPARQAVAWPIMACVVCK